MTEAELASLVSQRIRERFKAVRIRGGGAMAAGGSSGSFSVSMRKQSALRQSNTVVQPFGPPFIEIFKAENNDGRTTLRFNWAGAINNTRWTYKGKFINSNPHPIVDLTGGKKFYAFVTFTTTAGEYVTEETHQHIKYFSGLTFSSAEIKALDYHETPSPLNVDVQDPENAGTYTAHCILARYDGEGNEVPLSSEEMLAETAGNPWQIGLYGWPNQEPPFTPDAFTRMGVFLPPPVF